MKQIGFDNFRRFKHFPSLDLAPITIFAGKNLISNWGILLTIP